MGGEDGLTRQRSALVDHSLVSTERARHVLSRIVQERVAPCVEQSEHLIDQDDCLLSLIDCQHEKITLWLEGRLYEVTGFGDIVLRTKHSNSALDRK